MRICDILQQSLIVDQLAGEDKNAVLQEMAQLLSQQMVPRQATGAILEALLNRELLGSTGVGDGVAIPHAKIDGLDALVACFGRKSAGIDYDAIDYQPVKLIFMLLVPKNSAGPHLKALARVSRLLKNAAFRDRLLQLPSAAAVWEAFLEEDNKPQAPQL